MIIFIIAGPDLPIALVGHSTVTLGFGQAILGGYGNGESQRTIYHMTCSEHICMITQLRKELSVPRLTFVAIPIPDSMSGCISGSKCGYFH